VKWLGPALVATVMTGVAVAFSGCGDSFYFDSQSSNLTADGGDGGGSSADGSVVGSVRHCMIDSDCQLANLHCDQFTNQCVECVTSADCPSATPGCDTLLHRCVQCGKNDDCPQSPKPEICEPMTHTCLVTCSEKVGDDCPAATPKCLDDIGHCVECISNLDCTGNGSKVECDPLKGRCTECDRDEECKPGKPRCDRIHDVCVECTSSADCPTKRPLCDPSTYTCVPAH